MKGKDLKQAKVYKVMLDKERPFTFDFNALSELQENGYNNPYEAIEYMDDMNLKAIKSLFYACLVAGQMAEDENVELDISVAKVGNILGQYMQFDNDHFQQLFGTLGEAIRDFFPKPEEDKTTEEPKEVEKKNEQTNPTK